MKKINLKLTASLLALTLATLGANCASAQTTPLLPGDLVVVLYGDAGTPATTSGGQPILYKDGDDTPISLWQFSPTITAGVDNGTPLLAESLPTSGTGPQVGIVGENGSSSEGTIQVSGNGLYVTVGGYDGNLDERGGPYGATFGGIALAQSTCANVPRVQAVINIATGAVDTSTVLNDIYNTNNPRSVFSPDGVSLYMSGQGASKTDEGGLYLTTTGNNTLSGGSAPTGIFNVVSTRTVTQVLVDAANGVASVAPNLYYSADQNSSSKGTQTGIFEYAPSPTSSVGTNTGTRLTPVTGTVSGQTLHFSPEGFIFANATTLYVADTGLPKDGGAGNGGIEKWSYVSAGAVWKLDYTLKYSFSNSSSETGFASLAGKVVDGVVNLYATSYTANDADPDGLYGVADTLSNTSSTPTAGEAIVQLAASKTDSTFKAVTILPDAPVSTDTPVMPPVGLALLAVLMLLAGARLLPKRA